jgi:high-affinity iron transporter
MKSRILFALVALVAVLVGTGSLIFAPHAEAKSDGPGAVNVTAETEAIRDLLQESMRAYRLGDYQDAFKLSRTAYLDHFENIEIPLRVMDADLTLDMEYRFADLRTKMQAGAPASDVESAVRSVRDGLDEVDVMFSNTGVLAPALAFGGSFTIIFREGLEAVFVIAALLGYLRATGSRSGRRQVLIGIGLAVMASFLTWILLRFIIQIAPVGRELLEAVVSLVAVGMLFWVSFSLVSRLDRQRWMEFLRAQAWATMASGSALGLIGLGFTAIYREGFETALFYEVLLGLSKYAELYVLAGFLTGLAALFVVAWLTLRVGRKLPIKTFLTVAVSIVMFLSVAMFGQAVRELQEAGFINATSLIGIVPRIPRTVAEFTGLHPTVETLTAQAVLLSVYVVGGIVMWWRTRRYRIAPVRAGQVS